MASLIYDAGAYGLIHQDVAFLSDTLVLILMSSSYTPAKNDTHTQITAGEITGVSGYTGGWGGAGRKTLGTKTITNDTTNHRCTLDGADPSTYTALGTGDTIRAIVVAKKGTADDTTMVPICYCQLASDIPTNGGDVTLSFDAAGICYTQQ